jgi:ribose transport system ATP-binding protein
MNTKDSEVILSINDVDKSFPGVKALDGVSVTFQRGLVHGVVGENGAGKSTLMKILSGVYSKDAGTIVFDGETIEKTTPLEAMHRGLSIIYQELNLVNTMSVGENILLGRFGELKGMRNVHKRAKELLNSIKCDINTYTLVEDLSVSHKQMVEIAKALSFDSKLIIMDEPSSSLTKDEMKQLVEIIHHLKARNIAVIYISHKLDEIFELCDLVTVIRDGRVIDTKPITEITRNEMISMMVGRSIENEFPERPNCVGDTIMEVRSLHTKKLKDISFDLKKGEILGLVGLVGAGRTEIVRAIFGADRSKSCDITLEGKKMKISNPRVAIEAGLGFVTEDRKLQGLVLPFSVESNIVMASLGRITKHGFVGKTKEKDIAQKQVDSLSIKTPSIKTVIKNLSGGNQQKCIVGRWLELSPKILILDEPTRGIDVGAKYEIYVLMKEIVENGGSIIMISSELPEVLRMSNRVLTVCDGKISGEFDPVVETADTIMAAALSCYSERMAL